jgi:hypothetical protein
MTTWTNDRLERLLARYNHRFFAGRLSHYRVRISSLPGGCQGRCDKATRRIHIDIAKLASDQEVRRTLLHEMAHAAAKRIGHGWEFFEQVERLLEQGAPIRIDVRDAHYAKVFHNVVPARFPLASKAMQRVEASRKRAVEPALRQLKAQGEQVEIVDDDYVCASFKDAAMTCTWKRALVAVGIEFGLTDDLGLPLDKRAARMIAKGRRAFNAARRDVLQEERWHVASANLRSG